jgi:hypothetical protein
MLILESPKFCVETRQRVSYICATSIKRAIVGSAVHTHTDCTRQCHIFLSCAFLVSLKGPGHNREAILNRTTRATRHLSSPSEPTRPRHVQSHRLHLSRRPSAYLHSGTRCIPVGPIASRLGDAALVQEMLRHTNKSTAGGVMREMLIREATHPPIKRLGRYGRLAHLDSRGVGGSNSGPRTNKTENFEGLLQTPNLSESDNAAAPSPQWRVSSVQKQSTQQTPSSQSQYSM